MKKVLFALPLLALGTILTLTFCSKESPITQDLKNEHENTTLGNATVSDREEDPEDSDICSPYFQVRIDYQPNGISEYNGYKIYEDHTFIKWYGVSCALECGVFTMVPNVWYPVTILENHQYQLNYTYRKQCNRPAPEVCMFSIRSSGGHIKQYVAQSDYPAYFYRVGCKTVMGTLP